MRVVYLAFVFLSTRFDRDENTKETQGAILKEGPTPAYKPSKGTKGRDVSNLSFLLFLVNEHVACVCQVVGVPFCVVNES